jgi:hypothetical protein
MWWIGGGTIGVACFDLNGLLNCHHCPNLRCNGLAAGVELTRSKIQTAIKVRLIFLAGVALGFK